MSSLGQPFRAHIDLLARPHELAALTPRLASPDTYRQAEIPYSPALAGLSVELKQSNGQAYLEVTSSRSLNELYIDLLVEVQLGSTRLARKYTALIDPTGIGPASATLSRVPFPDTQPASGTQSAANRIVATYVADSNAARDGRKAVQAHASKPPRDAAADAAEPRALLDRIRVLEESSLSQERNIAELNQRIALMEKTIEDMRRSLDSWKPGVADGQQQAEPARTEVTMAPKPERAPADTMKAVPKSALPPEQPAARSKPDKPGQKAVPPPAKSDLINTLLGLHLYLVSVGLVILLGVLAFWMRRRRASPKSTPEDALVKLLEKNPGREDLQYELLEIYFARENSAMFHRAATAFKQVTGGRGERWRKVAIMGNALDRGNPMYQADIPEDAAPATRTGADYPRSQSEELIPIRPMARHPEP